MTGAGSAATKFGLGTALMALSETLFVTKPVHELLFDGYTDPFIELVDRLKKSPWWPANLNIPFPDRVGFFYGV